MDTRPTSPHSLLQVASCTLHDCCQNGRSSVPWISQVPLLISSQLRFQVSDFRVNAYEDALIALCQNLSSAICGSIIHSLIVTPLLWPTSLEIQNLSDRLPQHWFALGVVSFILVHHLLL
jgi:hypothetical protein